MKARWTMAATLFAVVAATLVLAGAAAAQPPSQTGQVIHIDETYVDPDYSSACGFDVLTHDVGVLQFSFTDDLIRVHARVRQTLTNPETGTSVAVLYNATETVSVVWLDENDSFSHTFTIRGLNYKVLGAEGTEVSAGRYSQTFTVFFDENGNIVDFTFENSQTPHLSHLQGSGTLEAICETLAQ